VNLPPNPNPYASPGFPSPGFPVQGQGPHALTREQARSKLIVPAIGLIAVSGILILLFTLDAVLFAAGGGFNGGFPGLTPQASSILTPGFFIGVMVFAALANAFTLVCAVQLLRVRMWGLAFAGAIVSALPLTSSACCLLTLPFAIWAIVVMLKPEVRAAFSAPAGI
jgi:hypothetical protein